MISSKPTGGQASFGYMWRRGKLVPNPLEAPVRKLIYELFIEHRRKKTVASILNEQGYRTRNGAKFGYSTVARLLRDPTAKGIHRVNYTTSLGINKPWQRKPEEEWCRVKVEPIVSEEIWEACNLILDEQENQEQWQSRSEINLFTGVTYCHCGHRMYMPSNSPKYVCPQCRTKIPKNDLEDIFLSQLKTLSSSHERSLQSSWSQLSNQAKRKMLEATTERITVGDDRITIILKYH